MVVQTKKQTLMNLKLKELKELARLVGVHSGKMKKEEIADALSRKLSSKQISKFTKIRGGGDECPNADGKLHIVGILMEHYLKLTGDFETGTELDEDLQKILSTHSSTIITVGNKTIKVPGYISQDIEKNDFITFYNNNIHCYPEYTTYVIGRLIAKLKEIINSLCFVNYLKTDTSDANEGILLKLVKWFITLKCIQNIEEHKRVLDEKIQEQEIFSFKIEHIEEVKVTLYGLRTRVVEVTHFSPFKKISPDHLILNNIDVNQIFNFVNTLKLKENIITYKKIYTDVLDKVNFLLLNHFKISIQ